MGKNEVEKLEKDRGNKAHALGDWGEREMRNRAVTWKRG